MTDPSGPPPPPPDATAGLLERILDAAGIVFEAEGVEETAMAEVARVAGCTPAELYRHYPSRLALQVAVLARSARRLDGQRGAQLTGIDEPGERLVAAILWAMEEVRSAPTLAAWFERGDGRVASQLIQDSAEILAMAAVELGDPADPDVRDRARWVVRMVVSLLSFPGADAVDERDQLERFLVPVVLPAPPGAGMTRRRPGFVDLRAPTPGRRPASAPDHDPVLADRILDAALVVFGADGFAEADVVAVAAAAGCSEWELEQQFPVPGELPLRLIEREGSRLVAHASAIVRSITDPATRLVEASLIVLRDVRTMPLISGWFEEGYARLSSHLILASDVLVTTSAAVLGDATDPDVRRRAQWHNRVIASILTFPGHDTTEERAMLTRYVAPVVC